jgi:transcriptional regulator with XRE-family HTH domain
VDSEQGWQRLATAVKARREERGWTQLEVATRGGLSIDRIQAIESVRTNRYSPRTLTKLERGLDWELGSCQSILAGGEPTPTEGPKPDPTDRAVSWDELLELIQHAKANDDQLIYDALMAVKRLRDARNSRPQDRAPEGRRRQAG